jgi:hypothetical protein
LVRLRLAIYTTHPTEIKDVDSDSAPTRGNREAVKVAGRLPVVDLYNQGKRWRLSSMKNKQGL